MCGITNFLVLTFLILCYNCEGKPVEDDKNVEVVEYEFINNNEKGYSYRFGLSNDHYQTQNAYESKTADGRPFLYVTGFYKYIDPDGKLQRVEYTADDQGFRLGQPVVGYASPALLASLAGGGIG